ncbi:MAG: hypothetical protein ACO1OG_07110 [Devosia sp.]
MIRIAVVFALALSLTAGGSSLAMAQESDCSTWKAEMMEDEGGEVFTAQVCAADRPDAYLFLNCFDGEIFLRYDLAMGAERSPDLDEERMILFSFADGEERVAAQYQDMDGMFAGDLSAKAPLITRLSSGAEVRIGDTDSIYPIHTFGLSGSAAALGELLAQCN